MQNDGEDLRSNSTASGKASKMLWSSDRTRVERKLRVLANPCFVLSWLGKQQHEGAYARGRTSCVRMDLIPSRGGDGEFRFPDTPSFRPNLSPKEIFQSGSFGGTYFRPIYSSVVRKRLKDAWKEFPDEWFEGLDIQKQVASPLYDVQVNLYKAKTGLSLEEWEGKGWITTYDPYGWVQWYCRFFLGRRTPDDSRQIGRWSAIAGAKGRWKRNLIHKVVLAEKEFEDASVSPVIRQLLQHWAYRLTEDHFDDYAKQVRAGKRTSFIPTAMAPSPEEFETKKESEKRKKDEQRAERLERRKRLR